MVAVHEWDQRINEWKPSTNWERATRSPSTNWERINEWKRTRKKMMSLAEILNSIKPTVLGWIEEALAGERVVVRAAQGTIPLPTITHTAPGTADYAIQNFTQTTPWGFASQDEANTALSVIANLQARVTELESQNLR